MSTIRFSYQAYDARGHRIDGHLTAESEREVIAALKGRRLVPVKVTAVSEAVAAVDTRSIKSADLIEFTNGLRTLVQSRVPLDRALMLLERMSDSAAVQSLVSALRKEIKEGKSLADAMDARPGVFSKMYVNMVRAGEEGGILGELLPKLARFLEESEETRKQVISALIYPSILMIVGLLSVVLLLAFVVPRFAGLFEGTGAASPASAAFLLSFSAGVKAWWWVVIALPLALAAVWRWMGRAADLRLQRDGFLLRVPMLGRLLLYQGVVNFCRTLGALTGAGVPLVRALRISRQVLENRVLIQDLEQVEQDVRAGAGLGRALEGTGRFPVLMHQLVVVGEETGRTSEILSQLAETFDRHVRHQVTRMVALLEPALILGLGVLVGGIVVIMLSAVFSINDVGL